MEETLVVETAPEAEKAVEQPAEFVEETAEYEVMLLQTECY